MPVESLDGRTSECPLCRDAFERERDLRSHLRADHDGAEFGALLLAYVDELDDVDPPPRP
ncbi:C2H2-type zinc finger protein [Salinilacihabitans rarus]|uniref:C2H2-type zinc finger protein n=1 Tax=Salinilacihabitans rarus TaxID=2961596 RepID=UPI0020C9340E|nr:C2H2-type zinc finger protein [Salinilacihabitans rarus]